MQELEALGKPLTDQLYATGKYEAMYFAGIIITSCRCTNFLTGDAFKRIVEKFGNGIRK